jgi:hypothetical protein
MVTSTNDVKVQIKKEQTSHWLMKGLKSREFLVTNLNQWDPHPLNITKNHISKVQSNYDVLATTNKRGP